MWRTLYGLPGRARRQVARDLDADPYLPYVLVLAAVLAGFWFWHSIPNFATRDARDRLFDALVVYGTVVEDPGLASLRTGIEWGRAPFGATLYLNALALAPIAAIASLTGRLDLFSAFASADPTFGYWAVWHSTPEWVWTGSLALLRAFNVAFAVGCVYLVYRIGVSLRDRATGRLAALLTTLTWGLLALAHEAGEDVPTLFFVLLAVALALRYVETGDAVPYLVGCGAGGVALAFKFTAAPVVLALGVAYFLRARETVPRDALVRPGLVIGGIALGATATALGLPTLLAAGPEPIVERVVGGATKRAERTYGPDAPAWWWLLRQYFNGLGLPLFVASAAGVLASAVALVARSRNRATSTGASVLLLTVLGAYLAIFSRWHDLRTHHLLPTFPLLVVLLAAALSRLRERSPGLARPLVALLLVTSGSYAVAGDLGYATQPRDQAVAWLDANAPANATMEVSRRDLQDAAIPHGMEIQHVWGQPSGETVDPCPTYIQVGYRDLLYLSEGTYFRNGQREAAYLRSLLAGEYGYEIAAEFGQRPPNFVPRRPTPGSLVDLLEVGLLPRTGQYADEQEVGPNQYTAILERTGPCDRSRDPPF